MLTILLDPLKKVKYHLFVKQKTPAETPISTGVVITTAEAAMTVDTFIIGPRAVKPQQEISHDLPQLQTRSGKGR